MPRRVWWRLTANAVLGVALLWWLHAFTEWGDTVGGLLALGGILSWLAVIAKVLPKNRGEQLQAMVADWLLETPKAWRVTALLAAAIIVTFFVASVQVENASGNGDVLVRDYQKNRSVPSIDDAKRVPTGGRIRSLYWVNPFASKDIRVKVSGLPTKTLDGVQPWWATFSPVSAQVSGSFLRPVVLVWGPHFDVKNADPKTYQLKVWVGKDAKPAYDEAYDGRAVFIGANDDDLQLPAKLRDEPEWIKILAEYYDRVLPPIGTDIRLDSEINVRAVLEVDGQIHADSQVIAVHRPFDREGIVYSLLLKDK